MAGIYIEEECVKVCEVESARLESKSIRKNRRPRMV